MDVPKLDFNVTFPKVSYKQDKTSVDVRYPLILPYANAHIYWDSKLGEIIYDLEEPLLTAEDQENLKKLHTAIQEMININVSHDDTKETMEEYLHKIATLVISETQIKMTEGGYYRVFYYLYRDFYGLNEIEALMHDAFIEDIQCNGVGQPIYIVHRVFRNMRTAIQFDDVDKLASFVEKVAQKCGKYISYASPLLDGSLPDGSRVNATYTKDVSSRGPTFCFKRGNIQLADGSVKDVEQLFQEAKSDFGSRLEDDNEIIEPNNLGICGVDENSLQQEDSKITSLIKLKAPEKLVKIDFEDGGEVEVTLNHKFHVVDNILSLVEAKDLKSGMLVPMPKKIIAQGYRQKIDIYSLIKDFSYSHKICIVNSIKINNLICAEIGDCGKNYRQSLSEKYGVSNSYFYEIINRGGSISFNVLDKLCSLRGVNFEGLGDIMLNVYGGGTKNKSKAVKIPDEIDEDLAYLAGALISDGHLSSTYVDFSCYETSVGDAVKKSLINKFGRFDSYYQDKRHYLCNLFIPYYFNKVFGIPIGNKSRIVKVPQRIFKSDNKVISYFLKGLFDGDGTASAGLSYKTYSKALAEGVTYLLARLGIYSYIKKDDEGIRVNVPSPYYELFRELIGFSSSFKSNLLNELIGKQVLSRVSQRHNRIPGAPILSIIKKLGVTRAELLRHCSFGTHNRFNYITFSREFAMELFNEISKHEKAGLVREELEYLGWLINSKQEFVKIDSVEIIDNRDPVYDIELSPCKFFVAGNKPMNMFDTIRKFTKIPFTPLDLIKFGTLSPEMLAFLWIMMQYKLNVLIAGGTGSGKTTLLNAVAFFIPPEARVVSIEDTRELNLSRENWLPSVVRAGITSGGVGEVDMFSLLRASFRQIPDYVIVGEVRGKEAAVLFQGMASGHASMATIHADSVETVIRRLETPPIELPPTLVNELDAVVVMTHAVVNSRETRKLREIIEVISVLADGTAKTNTPFMWDPGKDKFYFKKDSRVFEKIEKKIGMSVEKLNMDFDKRVKLIYELYKRQFNDFEALQKLINDFYKNPEAVYAKFGIQ